MDEPLVVNLVKVSQRKKAPKPTFALFSRGYYNSEMGFRTLIGRGLEASVETVESEVNQSSGRMA